MKNPQPNKMFLTTDALRNILNDDEIKGKNLRVVFADYSVRHNEFGAQLLNIVGFTTDGRKEIINELVIYADRYETPTPKEPKNPNKKTHYSHQKTRIGKKWNPWKIKTHFHFKEERYGR